MWRNRFGPLFAAYIRRRRVSRMPGFRQSRWHLDEAYAKTNLRKTETGCDWTDSTASDPQHQSL